MEVVARGAGDVVELPLASDVVPLRLILTEVGAGGLHRRHRGHCYNSPRDWRSGSELVSSQRRWSQSDVPSGAVEDGGNSFQQSSSRCVRTSVGCR